MKKYIWPVLLVFFLLGGLTAILFGKVLLPPKARAETVQAIAQKWSTSGHADREDKPFTYWNDDDPPEIPPYCAKCHSAYGFLDFLGEDGTEPFVVNHPAPVGSVVSCEVCHNNTSHEKDFTRFPSGIEIQGLGMTSNCAECHQGTESMVSVTNMVKTLPDDEVNDDLGFINVHYRIDAATRYGADVAVAYQYPGKHYDGFFKHVPKYQNCTDCHDPHSLNINTDECATCHSVVTGWATLRDIREAGRPDFDSDGNSTEGIYYEIETLHEMLLKAIQTYAKDVLDQPIVYSHYPYWMNDTNGNGIADPDEVNFGNSYKAWTPRLVKATFNYHLVGHSAGFFAHNPRYAIQVLYDTIEDLASVSTFKMPDIVRP